MASCLGPISHRSQPRHVSFSTGHIQLPFSYFLAEDDDTGAPFRPSGCRVYFRHIFAPAQRLYRRASCTAPIT